jgi:hypothetical protein
VPGETPSGESSPRSSNGNHFSRGTRASCTILEDLEEKVMALRVTHAKLYALDAGPSFGDVVARSRPETTVRVKDQ